MNKKLKVFLDKKTKQYYIKLPNRLLKELNWKIGDNIEWVENKNGSYTLTKV